MAADNEIELEIKLREQATAQIRAIEDEIKRLKKELEKAQTLKGFDFAKDLQKTRGIGKILKKEFEEHGRTMHNALKRNVMEAQKEMRKGTFLEWYKQLLGQVENLDGKIIKSKGKRKAITAEEWKMLRRFDAANQVGLAQLAKEIRDKDRLLAKENQLGVVKARNAVREEKAQKRANRAKNDATTAEDREERKRLRQAELNENTRLNNVFRSLRMQSRALDDQATAEVKAIKTSARAREDAINRAFAADRRRGQIMINSERMRQRQVRDAMKDQKARLSRKRFWLEEDDEYAHRMKGRNAHYSGTFSRNAKLFGDEIRKSFGALNHPFFHSPAFLAMSTLTLAILELTHVMSETVKLDKSMTDLSIRSNMTPDQLDQTRTEALKASIGFGVDPEHYINILVEAASRGLPQEMQKALPSLVLKFSEAVNKRPEEIGEATSEYLAQESGMHQITSADQMRRVLNAAAAVAPYAGADKIEQMFRSGLAERGSMLHLDAKDSLILGGTLAANGARSGQFVTRAMGLLATHQGWRKKWEDSHFADPRDEEQMAFSKAPTEMGYHSFKELEDDAGGANKLEGILRFFQSFGKIADEKQRLLAEKGFGFTQQDAPMIEGIIKGKERADKIREEAEKAYSEGTDGHDSLSAKQAKYRQGLEYMLGVFRSGFDSMLDQIGNELKKTVISKLVEPFQELSLKGIDNLPAIIDRAVVGFITGLGYKDVDEMIAKMKEWGSSFNIADFTHGVGEFMKGVGEGLKTLKDILLVIVDIGSHLAGTASAETLGKLSTELFTLAGALGVLAPVIGIFRSIGHMIVGMGRLALAGQAAGALAGVEGAELGLGAVGAAGAAASGLLVPVAIAGLTIGAIAVTVMNWDYLVTSIKDIFHSIFGGPTSKSMKDVVESHIPKEIRDDPVKRRAWLMENRYPGDLRDEMLGYPAGRTKDDDAFPAAPAPGSRSRDPIEFRRETGRLLNKSAFEGDEDFHSLIHKAAYISPDSANETRKAILGTERAVTEMRDAIIKTGWHVGIGVGEDGSVSFSTSTGGGGFGGGVHGGGGPNMRYGRNSGGGYRLSPGAYGNPSKSLLDFIAQSEGTKGYNTSLGFGKFLPGGKEQDLTKMNLNQILELGNYMRRQPGNPNSSALGRYQMTGQTIQDLMKRMHLSGNELFDEKMQDSLASKLITDEGPRALGRWASLKGGRMQTALGLLKSGQIASQPGSAGALGKIGNIGGKTKGVNPVLLAMAGRASEILGEHIDLESGFRDPEHNRAVGGAEHSLHTRGLAADLAVAGHAKGDKAYWAKVNDAMAQAAKELHQAYRWGGNFGGAYTNDNNHFDLTEAGASPEATAAVNNAGRASTIAEKMTKQPAHPRTPTPESARGGGGEGAFTQKADAGGGNTYNFNFHHNVSDHTQLAAAVGRVFEEHISSRYNDTDHHVG